jgi:hypothetical protein
MRTGNYEGALLMYKYLNDYKNVELCYIHLQEKDTNDLRILFDQATYQEDV